MQDLKIIVSENISKLRIDRKMTQLELGQALSYSDKAVSKWERGEAIPDAYVLLQMSRLFGVTVDYLLTSHDSEPLPQPPKKRTNHVAVALITVIAIFTVAALAFAILFFADFFYPIMFQYAAVASFLVLTVMNSVWGKSKHNVIFVSAFVQSILFTVYFIFLGLGKNYWQLLLLAIPIELIILLSFLIKFPGLIKSELFKKSDTSKKNNTKNDL